MLRRSKSIEEIYIEVKDYDLVITNDAPLATALNKLVVKARLDYFAMTPRQIAAKYALLRFGKLYSKAELIIEISLQSKKPLKEVHHSIEKIFDVWNNTGILENCKLYLGREEMYLKFIKEHATIELAMENFDESFYGNKSIAVAGPDLFNELDKQVLPRKGNAADEIFLFSKDEIKIDKSYLFNSSNELVNRIVSLINKDIENDSAIVLNTDSEFLEILKSRLNEKGIKLQLKKFLSEDFQVANIISFIEASFRADNLKLKDLTFFESLFEINLNKKYNQYYLNKYIESLSKDNTLRKAYDIMVNINSYTYGKLFELLRKKFKIKIKKEFSESVELLELNNKKIDENNFNLISYFLEYIDMEITESDEGVLFVNALNSAYIDRALIIFVGLDTSWFKLSPEKQYIKKTDEEKKNLSKFQILLSQGHHKLFFTLDQKENEYMTPCYYFNMLADRSINRFDDKFFNPVHAGTGKAESIFEPKKENMTLEKPKLIESISPSSLNKYFSCPKKFSYSRMIPQEEKTYFSKGTLLHYFAEFYFNYPEYVSKNFDAILELLLKDYSVLIKNIEIEKTVFTIGMKVIMQFLDTTNFRKVKLEKPVENERNFLFKVTGKEKIYQNTEHSFSSTETGVSGKIDLTSDDVIVDFKTGKNIKKGLQLRREFKVESIKENEVEDINFQTAAYIAGKREFFQNTQINFFYLYLLSKINDFIKEKFTENEIQRKAKYIHKTLKEFVLSEEFFTDLDDIFLKRIGYENYKNVMQNNFEKFDFYNLKLLLEILENPFYDIAINKAKVTHKEFNKNLEKTFREDIVRKSLKKIHRMIIGTDSEGLIFKDDIDNFIDMVKDKIKEINSFLVSDFPNKPILDLRSVCKDCDYLNICTGNKLWSGNEITDVFF